MTNNRQELLAFRGIHPLVGVVRVARCFGFLREKKKAKRTNNDLQNITYTEKNKDRATRTPLTISRQDMLRVNTDQVD
jgi:hypothetical protein